MYPLQNTSPNHGSGKSQQFPVTPGWFESGFELGGLGEPYGCYQ